MKALTPKQRLILGVLRMRAEETATQLALAVRVLPRAVHQQLDALEKKGLVTTRIERNEGSRRNGQRIARITASGLVAIWVEQ